MDGVVVSHGSSLNDTIKNIDLENQIKTSHANNKNGKNDSLWIELLVNGLTYDLSGFVPGRAAALPQLVHRFDGPDIEGAEAMEGLVLTPGPHLSGAENTMPVVRTMMDLAVRLGGGMNALAAMAWGPSRSIMGSAYFAKNIRNWLDGGPFPALGLTAFRQDDDGSMHSEGLDFFTGQELRIDPALADDRVAATKLAIRLINELVGSAPLERSLAFSGPKGDALQLEPSGDGRLIQVTAA